MFLSEEVAFAKADDSSSESHNATREPALPIAGAQGSRSPSAILCRLAVLACSMGLTACVMTSAGGTVGSPDLVAEGRAFANLNCASCHAPDRSDLSANWDAPPMKRLLPRLEFKMLERDRTQDAIMSHGQMPPLHLSMADKEALVAYFKSIADPPIQ